MGGKKGRMAETPFMIYQARLPIAKVCKAIDRAVCITDKLASHAREAVIKSASYSCKLIFGVATMSVASASGWPGR